MSCCCFHWGSFNHSASTPLLLESHSPERTASSAPPDFPPSETPPPAALSPSPSAAPEIGSTPGCRKPPENFPTAAPRAAGSWYPATPGPRTPSDGCLPHPGSSWRCETLRSLGSSPASLGSDPDRCRCERWSAIPPLQKGALFPQQTCCPGSVSSSPSWSSASGYGCTGWLQFFVNEVQSWFNTSGHKVSISLLFAHFVPLWMSHSVFICLLLFSRPFF